MWRWRAAASAAVSAAAARHAKSARAYGPDDAYGADARPRVWEEVRDKSRTAFTKRKRMSSITCDFGVMSIGQAIISMN